MSTPEETIGNLFGVAGLVALPILLAISFYLSDKVEGRVAGYCTPQSEWEPTYLRRTGEDYGQS